MDIGFIEKIVLEYKNDPVTTFYACCADYPIRMEFTPRLVHCHRYGNTVTQLLAELGASIRCIFHGICHE